MVSEPDNKHQFDRTKYFVEGSDVKQVRMNNLNCFIRIMQFSEENQSVRVQQQCSDTPLSLRFFPSSRIRQPWACSRFKSPFV
jgi:hypothetical protein